MPFVELFTPRGALDEGQRSTIGGKLVTEIMQAEGAPDTEAARAISWLVVNEVEEFWIGRERWSAETGPLYVVRVGVPEGSLTDEKRLDMVRRVTRVLAEVDPDPKRLLEEPTAWVHINEIPEGNWGAFGRIVGLRDIRNLVRPTAPATA
jgi:phenylpyruvate tautomerase PptA (4-oxalocrotonate tautomerase family)